MSAMVNLLPVAYRRRQLLRRRAIQWSTAICLVLVFGWTSHWYELREQRALSQQLEVLTREYRPTQTMLQQLVEMRQQLEDLQQRETVARELEYQRNALALLGTIGQAARQTNGRLRVTKLELTDFQQERLAEEAAATGPRTGGLILSGVSLDNPAVAELLDGLQDSGLFTKVELLTLKERSDKDVSLRDYEVRCEF